MLHSILNGFLFVFGCIFSVIGAVIALIVMYLIIAFTYQIIKLYTGWGRK